MQFSRLLSCLVYLSASIVNGVPFEERPRLPLPAATVASLEQEGTWFENIAVRPNGNILVDLMQPNATIYTLRNCGSDAAELIPLVSFPDADGVLGITEVAVDTFVVNTYQFSAFVTPIPDTAIIWEVKFTSEDTDDFQVRRIVEVADTGLLNGMTSLSGPSGIACPPSRSTAVLVADSYNGELIRVDLDSGNYEVILDEPELKKGPAGEGPGFGINGVHVYHGHLFWTNTDAKSIYRIAIDGLGYPEEDATVETLITIPEIAILDDFTFDGAGNIWGAALSENKIVRVAREGGSTPYDTYEFVAGDKNTLAVAGPSSVAWGKGIDAAILFISTTGAIAAPVNGNLTEPAKVVAIDTSRY
jgi:hypothetical protein